MNEIIVKVDRGRSVAVTSPRSHRETLLGPLEKKLTISTETQRN